MSSLEPQPGVDAHRADQRFHTDEARWLDSRHSLSFGRHYDPGNTRFGLLLVSNEDVLKAGTGFDTHPHRDMEIGDQLDSGDLVLVAAGLPRHTDDRAIFIQQRQAALWAARLAASASARLPDSPLAHLFVARGSVELKGEVH